MQIFPAKRVPQGLEEKYKSAEVEMQPANFTCMKVAFGSYKRSTIEYLYCSRIFFIKKKGGN